LWVGGFHLRISIIRSHTHWVEQIRGLSLSITRSLGWLSRVKTGNSKYICESIRQRWSANTRWPLPSVKLSRRIVSGGRIKVKVHINTCWSHITRCFMFSKNVHEKKDFASVFKNLARYRSKNSFIGWSK